MKHTARQLGVLALLLFSPVAEAQGPISTIAGNTAPALPLPDVISWRAISGVAVDNSGQLFLAERNRIWLRDSATGALSTVFEGSAVGRLGAPYFSTLQFDRAGTLWSLDVRNKCIYRIVSGVAESVVGQCSADVSSLSTLSPDGFTIAADGTLFVNDDGTRIYSFDPATAELKLIAGKSAFSRASPLDGAYATEVDLGSIGSLAVDASRAVYFTHNLGAKHVRRIDPQSGILTSVGAFSFSCSSNTIGELSKICWNNPHGLRFGPDGLLYLIDGGLRRIDFKTGIVDALAGKGATREDGLEITSFTIAASGLVWLVDTVQGRLFSLTPGGLPKSEAGTFFEGDGGPALTAVIGKPSAMALDNAGSVYLAAGAIRRINAATGSIETLYGDGPRNLLPATKLAVHSSGTIYFSAEAPGGTTALYRLAPGSGPATPVLDARGKSIPTQYIAFDRDGSLLAVIGHCIITRIQLEQGTITRLAGNGDCRSQNMEGPATETGLGNIASIASAPGGVIYFTSDGFVMKVDALGNLAIVAGSGSCHDSGDGGPAILAGLCQPSDVNVDENGNVFVASDVRIRRIAAADGTIQTVAGNGKAGLGGDGIPATESPINGILAMTVGNGMLYLAEQSSDGGHARIRAVARPIPPPMPQPPLITSVENAASQSTPCSPGGIISIFGHYLGPASPRTSQQGADGRVTNTLANVILTPRIPILYASAGQINAVLPSLLSVHAPVSISLRNPIGFDGFSVRCYGAALAIFPGAVINEDGSFNDESHPARPGSVVTLYGTGMGRTTPVGIDGEIVRGPTLPIPITQFTATIDGLEAEILYLGSAPGLVYGVVQANVRIPGDIKSGSSYLFFHAPPSADVTLSRSVGVSVFVSR